MQVAAGQIHLTLQHLVHGDAVAGVGQRVAQRTLQRGAVEQGIAQREQQAGQQRLQLDQFVFGKALLATENQLTQVFPLMAQTIAGRVRSALAQLEAQVMRRMLKRQRIERHQALHFTKEQREDSFHIQAGLQLQTELVAQLYQVRGLERQIATAGKAETLQLGGIEIDGVGLAGGNHGAEPLALMVRREG